MTTEAIAQTDAACAGSDIYGVIVHGGTARFGTESEERLALFREMLPRLRDELAAGATALDTVEKAIVTMEDSGLFNAGRAAINNAGGFVETDASIMDGETMEAGAVASMRLVKNPIRAARLVMDETRHVMMVGDRGEAAVTERGAETVEPSYFRNNKHTDEPEEHGTVGAAVLDRCGNLAAGTSTGGYDAKIPGRVGDSPVIGAGTYARNGVLAASATGHGEYFIRFTATRSAAARMEYGGMSLNDAVAASIEEMAAAGEDGAGTGGIVAIGADGTVTYPHSTEGMYRAYATPDVLYSVGVFDEMETRRPD
nr:hypothetical protein GCM10011355_18070 [Aquisalinus luteolus]